MLEVEKLLIFAKLSRTLRGYIFNMFAVFRSIVVRFKNVRFGDPTANLLKKEA